MSESPDVWYQIEGCRQQRLREFSGRYVNDLMKAIKKEQLDQPSSILVPYVKPLDADEIEITETLLDDCKSFGNLIKQYDIDSRNPIRVRLPDAAPQVPPPQGLLSILKRKLEGQAIPPTALQAPQESLEANFLALEQRLDSIYEKLKAPQEDENCSKKCRTDDLPHEIIFSQKLFRRIKDKAPVDAKQYSNPANILRLPFPFLGVEKPTDRFAIIDGSFDYMGRKEFAQVLQEIENLKVRSGYTDLFIFGTMGYGKSHILAAMACLLHQQGKRVVFLPDCRAMAQDFLKYLKSALLLTFGDRLDYQNKIYDCSSVNNICLFCDEVVESGIRLYFIVDQLNALDLVDQEMNKDNISNTYKEQVRTDLRRITYNHYDIYTNYGAARYMEQKQTNERKIRLYGGLTEVEMQNWWRNYENNLPKCEEREKERIEDITGRCPLLLRALLRYQGKNFKDVEDHFLETSELQAVIEQVTAFTEEKKANLTQYEWENYVETMNRCILQRSVASSLDFDDTMARLLRCYEEDAFFTMQ